MFYISFIRLINFFKTIFIEHQLYGKDCVKSCMYNSERDTHKACFEVLKTMSEPKHHAESTQKILTD